MDIDQSSHMGDQSLQDWRSGESATNANQSPMQVHVMPADHWALVGSMLNNKDSIENQINPNEAKISVGTALNKEDSAEGENQHQRPKQDCKAENAIGKSVNAGLQTSRVFNQ